jgi:hypothetical protein
MSTKNLKTRAARGEKIENALQAVRDFHAKYPRKDTQFRPLLPRLSAWELLAKSTRIAHGPMCHADQTNDTVVVAFRQ